MTETKPTAPEKPQPETANRRFPPWSPVAAIILAIAGYFLASIAAEGILLAYAFLRGWSVAELQAWVTTSVYAQFINFVLVYGMMVGGIIAFVRSYKVSLRSLGFVRPSFTDSAIALMAIPVYLFFYVLLLFGLTAIFPGLDLEQEQQLGFDRYQQGFALFLTFVSLVILPPLAEEFVMRGFVFSSLLGRMRFVLAALFSSLLFASAHLQFGSGAPLLWTAAIDTFVLSLVLCYLRYKTGSLWAGIFLHMLKNLIAFLVIFVFHKG